MNTDLINACWEFAGAAFMLRAITIVLKDKVVKGIDWTIIFFFTTWGFWNTYFYPTNGFPYSFAGSVCLAAMNLIYLILLIYYSRKQT